MHTNVVKNIHAFPPQSNKKFVLTDFVFTFFCLKENSKIPLTEPYFQRGSDFKKGWAALTYFFVLWITGERLKITNIQSFFILPSFETM